MLCLSVSNYILVGCPCQLVFRTIFKHSWPGSDADLFTSQTYYIELSTRKFRRLNQLGTLISIWNGSAILYA